jgi:NitT/TauT family transport system substrate-binding protein
MRRSIPLLLCLTVLGCHETSTAPEQSQLVISVPGVTNVAFLPLTVADRVGFLAAEGLTVEIRDVANGAAARQLLQDGSAQAVMGFYEQTIQAQSEGNDLLGVALAAIRPGLVLAARSEFAASIRTVSDLRGRRVGVAALGTGTHNLLRYLLRKASIPESEVTVVPIGNGASAIQAVESKQVDALVGLDPAITTLLQRGLVVILEDTRTAAATRDVYGGDYAASSLYMQRDFVNANPRTTQRLVNATLAATAWLRTTPPDQIVTQLALGSDADTRQLWVRIITDSQEMFSQTGRFSEADVQRVLDAIKLFDDRVAQAQIDLSRTYTNRFVDAAK